MISYIVRNHGNRVKRNSQEYRNVYRRLGWWFALVLISLATISIQAQNVVQETPKEDPPLPLHGIEGSGGIFATYSAYLVNPAKEGEIFGLPSIAGFYVNLGHGRDLRTFTITETLWDRVELGYGWDGLDLGDLPEDIHKTVGADISDDYVNLHNFNARFALLKEGDFDRSWVPAVTAGVHYKYNDTIDDIDNDLGGALSGIGIESNDGVDFTLYATKLVTQLPRPVLFNLGLRASEGAHIGLLGFTDDYQLTLEGSVGVFVTDQFIVAGEYRQKTNNYSRIPGLVEEEDGWFSLLLAYIVNDHLVIGGGYASFGDVLNHEANGGWGVQVKWEF